MSHAYVPTPTALVSITLPDDGVDQRVVATVNTPMQTLADGIAYLAAIVPRVDVINTSGTWTVPVGVTCATVTGYGGGGGGAGGGNGTTAASSSACGGGAGGGSWERTAHLTGLVPGTIITTTVGAGGTAGPIATLGGEGSDTTFGALATFRGAQRGRATAGISVANAFTAGGGPVSGGNPGALLQTASTALRVPGYGGDGAALASGIIGAPSVAGFAGGALGSAGTPAGTGFNGGGAGGGGAGPGGAGGAGGAGGNGTNTAAAATAGTAGTAAAANTGGGGGGGGAGGQSTGAGAVGVGAVGGAGGSGRITVSYIGPQAVIT